MLIHKWKKKGKEGGGKEERREVWLFSWNCIMKYMKSVLYNTKKEISTKSGQEKAWVYDYIGKGDKVLKSVFSLGCFMGYRSRTEPKQFGSRWDEEIEFMRGASWKPGLQVKVP